LKADSLLSHLRYILVGTALTLASPGLATTQITGFDDQIAASASKGFQKKLKAARTGNPVAQYSVGRAFQKGKGIEQDYAKAVLWYRKSANQGHVKSQYRLGVAYRNGRGVQRDYMRSATWFRKAADQKYKKAFHALGYAYRKGLGVTRENMVATGWYRLAASEGYAKS
jgi:uncharacterized protein